jgi:hypothetical protein
MGIVSPWRCAGALFLSVVSSARQLANSLADIAMYYYKTDLRPAVAQGVNALRRKDRAMVLVTHYQRLLDYIVPDKVHVLLDGRIVRSGEKELALELEERGYDFIKNEVELAAQD